jgi:hypothetical protein
MARTVPNAISSIPEQPQRSFHGRRLSIEDYDRKIVALHVGLPPIPSQEQQRQVRRAELDLAIDHRLGLDFPSERRNALWAIQEKVEKRRGRLVFRYLLRKLLPGSVEKGASGLAGYLMAEYGKVLTREELECFFGEAEARDPQLPINRSSER